MGDDQNNGAGQSISELNSQHLTSRAALLSGAIQTALTSKGLDPAKPGKGKSGASKAAPATAGAPTVAPTVPAATEPEAPVAGSDEESASTVPDAEAAGADPADEPETEALAPELAELQELGKKKDLRALEKKLGLEEGSLGVNNGSWAAYRRRVEELETATTRHETNQRTLIDRFGPPAALIEQANKGNLKAYAGLIEQTTGVPIATFIEHWTKNTEQLDPRIVELERENRRLRSSGNLVREDGTPDKPAPVKVTAEAATLKADTYIAEEAGQHPAFKLSGSKEGVRKIWLESFNPKTKGFGLTPQQAAGEFVKERKAAYEREQWIISGRTPPKAPRTKTLTRQGSSETQVRTETLSREQAIELHANKWKRDKANGRA